MKIAMIIDGREPIFGGGQVHVKYLSEGLVTHYNCRVDVFVRKLKDDTGKKYTQDETKFDGKWRLFRIGPPTKFFNVVGRMLALIATTRYLLYKTVKERYDIIHAHAYVSGLPAKIVGLLTHTPVIYTVNGTM
ncbi:MAG: glycosyltransferase [Candidatus Peribacteria bacterium]|jgi:hypothetical protein|nr:glycosyltransferase [Candidatus Peribacteria bacterium]